MPAAPAPPAENGVPLPRSELEQLKIRASEITDESLESTRRILHLSEESKEAGIRTLVALDDQGEQLERIEEGNDQIDADMRQADENLSNMEKCCGICALPWNKSASFKKDGGTWKGNDDDKLVTDQPQRVIPMHEHNGIGPQAGYIARLTNDAREDEMEKNLEQVHTIIGNLRDMALDISSEVATQNDLIDRINDKTESNDNHVKVATKRAENLVKS